MRTASKLYAFRNNNNSTNNNNNNNDNNKRSKKRFPSPTVKMHLLVFLTDILFLMSQSTRTPPDGPTNALTTYGKAAKNPVYVQRFD